MKCEKKSNFLLDEFTGLRKRYSYKQRRDGNGAVPDHLILRFKSEISISPTTVRSSAEKAFGKLSENSI